MPRSRRRLLASATLLAAATPTALATTYNLNSLTLNVATATYTAADTLNCNNVTFSAAVPATLPAAVNLVGSFTSYISNTAALTFTGPLSGSSKLSQSGSGSLALSAPSPNFTGILNLGGTGVARLNDPLALGPANAPTPITLSGSLDVSGSLPLRPVYLNFATLLNNSATPVTLGPSFSVTGPTTNNSTSFTVSGTGDITFATPLPAATGSLFKSGAGTLTYATPTAFTGTLTASVGTLRLGIESPFAGSVFPVAVNNLATLDLNGFNSPGVPINLTTNSILVNNNPNSPSTLATLPTLASGVSLGGAGSLTLAQPLPTTRSFTKIGTGTLTLAADDTSYAGTITVNAGSLRLGTAAAAGNAATTYASSIYLATGSQFDLNGFAPPRVQVVLNGGALVNDNTTTPVTLASTSPIVFSGSSLPTLGGAGEMILTRTGGFTKVGTGVVTLARTTGTVANITINAGSVRLGNPAHLAATSALTVNPTGSFDLNGFPMPTGLTLTLNDGALVNNNTATPVTLNALPSSLPTAHNPAFGGDGTLNLNVTYILDNYATLNKVGTGLLTLNPSFHPSAGFTLHAGTLLVESNAQLGTSSFPTPILTFDGGALRVAPVTVPDPGSYTFSPDVYVNPVNGNTIDTQRDTTFTGGFYGAGTLTKTGTGTLALTKSLFQAAVGITVNQGKLYVPYNSGMLDWSFLTLNVDNGLIGTNTYRLGNLAGTANLSGYNSLTLVGPPTGSAPRSSTFAGTLSGGSLNLTGTAQLTLTGTIASSVHLNAGSLTIGDGGTTGTLTNSIFLDTAATLAINRADDYSLTSLSGSGTLTKLGAGTTTLSLSSANRLKLDLQAGTLRLAPSATAGQITSLSLTPAASLDLSTNKLVINYTGTTPAATLAQYLLAHQIHSAAVDADPQHLLTLAYAEAATLLHLTGSQTATWFGQTVDATSLLLAPAPVGDANLDGTINADDYALLDRAVARQTPNPHWTEGDFNYDGTINSQDYLLIDRTLLSQAQGLQTLSPLLAQRESQFGAPYVSQLLASLPEPSLLALTGLMLAATRRRPKNLKFHR